MKKYLALILFLILQACGNNEGDVDLSYRKQVFAGVSKRGVKTVKVALVLPITGRYSKVGQSALQGAMMSLSSIHNNYVSLVVFDTEGKPEKAKSIALKLKKNNIKMMIGPILPTSVRAVASVADKVGVPIITYSENRDIILGKKNMYTFGLVYDLEVERLVQFMVKQRGSKNFAILHPSNDYGDAMYVAFINAVKRNKGKIVSDVRYKPNKNDYKKEIQALIGKRAYYNYVREKAEAEARKPEDGVMIEEVEGEKVIKPKVAFDTLFIADYDKNLYLVASHLPIYDLDKTEIKIMGTRYWDSQNVKREYALRESYIPFYSKPEGFINKYRGYYKEPPVSFATEVADSVKMVSSLVYYDVKTKKVVYNFSSANILSYNTRASLRGTALMNKSRIVLRPIGVLYSSRQGDEKVVQPDINYIDHNINYESVGTVQRSDLKIIEKKKATRKARLDKVAAEEEAKRKMEKNKKKTASKQKQSSDYKKAIEEDNKDAEEVYAKPKQEEITPNEVKEKSTSEQKTSDKKEPTKEKENTKKEGSDQKRVNTWSGTPPAKK